MALRRTSPSTAGWTPSRSARTSTGRTARHRTVRSPTTSRNRSARVQSVSLSRRSERYHLRASRRRPMLTPHRTVAILIFAAIAYLGVACERTDTPTEARLMASLAGPARLLVYDDLGQCPTAQYTSSQMAVNDAQPGDHIDVCPGTYKEQVIISGSGKDNIQLRSTKQWAAVIQAPMVMVPDPADNGFFTILRISDAHNVTILAFTITGPGPTACGSLHYGVRVDHGGSANILGNHITDIRDQKTAGELSGCQNGMGVVVGGHFNDVTFSTGSARIEGNLVEKYQKNGVVVGGFGSSAVIAANRVLGFGPSPTIAQNGIEVLQDATAQVKHNFSSGRVYTGPRVDEATGVLPFFAGTADINHNTVAQNDVGVYVFESATGSLTSLNHNRTRSSTFDGILLDLTDNATVQENFTEQNRGPGIGLYEGASTNTVENNQIERNSTDFSSTHCPITLPPCYGGGILLHDASSNTVRGNHVRNNGTFSVLDNTDGIRVNAPSSENVIASNHLRGNVNHDCHDASTPASNTWVDNHGETSSPGGLCDADPQDAFVVEAVWDPSYPWYISYEGLVTDYDWPSLYSAIDAQIQGLLDLLPQVGVGGLRRPSP